MNPRFVLGLAHRQYPSKFIGSQFKANIKPTSPKQQDNLFLLRRTKLSKWRKFSKLPYSLYFSARLPQLPSPRPRSSSVLPIGEPFTATPRLRIKTEDPSLETNQL